jgi:hypothetical protein
MIIDADGTIFYERERGKTRILRRSLVARAVSRAIRDARRNG